MFTCIFQNSQEKIFNVNNCCAPLIRISRIVKNYFAAYSENFTRKVKTYEQMQNQAHAMSTCNEHSKIRQAALNIACKGNAVISSQESRAAITKYEMLRFSIHRLVIETALFISRITFHVLRLSFGN